MKQHKMKPAKVAKLAQKEVHTNPAIGISPSLQEMNMLLAMFIHNRYIEAEQIARALTVRFPRHGFGWKMLGAVLVRLGRSAEALQPAKSAVELLPPDADAHCTLGFAFNGLGQPSEAEAGFRRALELEPDFAGAHYTLGNTLYEQNRNTDAEGSYRRALEIKPDYADALVGLGELVAERGQFAEEEVFYQRALAIDPQICTAWAALAGIRKMTIDDAACLTGAEAIVRQGLPPRQESIVRFAMGKLCDDLHNYDQAFKNYFLANELVKSRDTAYDRQQQTLCVDQLSQAYHREQVRRAHPGASDSARPLFVVGMPRSGTSLIEQIVASHPAAFGAGELRFWGEVVEQHGPAVFAAELDEKLIGELADSCLSNLSRFSAGALRVVDKMPFNFNLLGLIHAAFPNARIIHAQRNPVDVCLSNYFQNFSAGYSYSNDLSDLAHYYREYRRLMAHWRSTLPADVFLDVPYEALVEDQEGWSRKIIEFIGLDWDDRCLDFHKTERTVATSSKWQVRQSIYKTSKERWRNYEKHIGPLFDLIGILP